MALDLLATRFQRIGFGFLFLDGLLGPQDIRYLDQDFRIFAKVIGDEFRVGGDKLTGRFVESQIQNNHRPQRVRVV